MSGSRPGNSPGSSTTHTYNH